MSKQTFAIAITTAVVAACGSSPNLHTTTKTNAGSSDGKADSYATAARPLPADGVYSGSGSYWGFRPDAPYYDFRDCRQLVTTKQDGKTAVIHIDSSEHCMLPAGPGDYACMWRDLTFTGSGDYWDCESAGVGWTLNPTNASSFVLSAGGGLAIDMRQASDKGYCADAKPGPAQQWIPGPHAVSSDWSGCDSTCQYDEASLDADLAAQTTSFGTPLVMSFDDRPVEFLGHGVPFDFRSDGTRPLADWVGPKESLLVLPDCRNNVTKGAQLFGTDAWTVDGAPAKNGFASLAQYDDNGDGKIDASDKVFASLGLWNDRDSNGVSTPDEVTALANDAGLIIDLQYVVVAPSPVPQSGFVGLAGDFAWGAVNGTVADVYFPMSDAK